MFIYVTPKKVNRPEDLRISATFATPQGVRYEERYKKKGHFLSALKRKKKDMFIDAVDLDAMKVIRRDDLREYMK